MSASFSHIALVGRFEDARVAESAISLARHLQARGREVLVDREAAGPGLPEGVTRIPEGELPARADLVVAIGGDGTMLYAAQLVVGQSVPLVGVNLGRLGFLTDVSPSGMADSFDALLEGQYERDERTLLAARLAHPGRETVTCHAMNDVVVQKHESGRMIELETWIGGAFVNTHGGDGLVVATSTGSTAYALSCGGPIIHPRMDALVLAPISPHTLSDRPIVVAGDAEVEVRLAARCRVRAQVTFDGTLLGDLDHGGSLAMRAAPERVTLLHPHGHDYFRILRSKLHWGRSARNPDAGS